MSLSKLFEQKQKNICSIFLTAGYPNLEDTVRLVLELETAGVDLIELGIPFSDPLADGPTIQMSSQQALKNGMNIKLLFEQVELIREKSDIPIVLMGYVNPVLKFGMDEFLSRCKQLSIQGIIIPDIPLEEYTLNFQAAFEQYEIPFIFLITPNTKVERIRKIEALSNSFIYLVSTSATTGAAKGFNKEQLAGFEAVRELKIKAPLLVGFGIHDSQTFNTVCNYFNGAIIGSAFIRHLSNGGEVKHFVEGIKQPAIAS